MAERPKWHRLPEESEVAYAAFKAYLELGEGRSLGLAAKKVRKSKGLMSRWSRAYNWAYRVESFDKKPIDKDALVAEALLEKDVSVWITRQEELRERAWSARTALLDKADIMLKWPHAKQEVISEYYPDGRAKTVTVLQPAKWTFRDVSNLMEVADKLGRMATEISPEYFQLVKLLEKQGMDIAAVIRAFIVRLLDG